MIDSELNVVIKSGITLAATISMLNATIESIHIGIAAGDKSAMHDMKDANIAIIVTVEIANIHHTLLL